MGMISSTAAGEAAAELLTLSGGRSGGRDVCGARALPVACTGYSWCSRPLLRAAASRGALNESCSLFIHSTHRLIALNIHTSYYHIWLLTKTEAPTSLYFEGPFAFAIQRRICCKIWEIFIRLGGAVLCH